LAFAAAAALIWANTAPGTLNALAYNVIFVASVSTLLFNMNPLMRFDGYHILADALEVPNLFQRSREQLRYLGERFVLQLPHAQPAARTATESWLLPTFGLLSMLYWLLLMFNIMLFIAGEYFELGVVLALLLFFLSLVLPLFKFGKYLATSPHLGQYRAHAVGISVVIAMATVVLLGLLPVPDRIRVMGVVQAGQARQLHLESEGFFAELLARPGAVVQQGQPLLRLSNPDLEVEIRAAQMQLAQLKAQEIQAVAGAVAELRTIYRQQQALEESLATIYGRKERLLVVAPMTGVWIASELDASRGQWLGRGTSAGTIVNQDSWRFVAVLPQVASHAFEDTIQQTEVRLRGQEELNLLAQATVVMPFEQGQLPARALGMAGGGEIAVSNADSSGLTAAESFFRIESVLSVDPQNPARLLHGHVGTMRLTLSDRPLFAQWERKLRQLLQRRFRV
jgi:putative peptide zinc metalloprotease protein